MTNKDRWTVIHYRINFIPVVESRIEIYSENMSANRCHAKQDSLSEEHSFPFVNSAYSIGTYKKITKSLIRLTDDSSNNLLSKLKVREVIFRHSYLSSCFLIVTAPKTKACSIIKNEILNQRINNISIT